MYLLFPVQGETEDSTYGENFKYDALKDELVVGEIYVRVFNEQPTFVLEVCVYINIPDLSDDKFREMNMKVAELCNLLLMQNILVYNLDWKLKVALIALSAL